MTENEQIEEMAKVLYEAREHLCIGAECEFYMTPHTDEFDCRELWNAKRLYAKGYRKVERGENVTKNHPVDEFICSKCGIHLEEWSRVVTDEDADDTYYCEYAFKFCPECGADTRGEKE